MNEGGCLCSAIRYRLHGTPVSTVICHCTHCQKSSGAAFSVNLLMKAENVEMDGTCARYTDRADRGADVERCFCGTCGSSIMSVLDMGLVAIKAGSLDDPSVVAPSVQFWCRSRLAWIDTMASLPPYDTVKPPV